MYARLLHCMRSCGCTYSHRVKNAVCRRLQTVPTIRSNLKVQLQLVATLRKQGISLWPTWVLCLFCSVLFYLFIFFTWVIRKLKMQLQQLRWKRARNVSHEYRERSCARCQKSLGLLMNRGAVCNGCSHRVCSECRVCLNPCIWKCTVCYAHG